MCELFYFGPVMQRIEFHLTSHRFLRMFMNSIEEATNRRKKIKSRKIFEVHNLERLLLFNFLLILALATHLLQS